MKILKRGKQESTPFFTGDRVEFSLEWRSLFKGSVVGEGVFRRPNLNLIQGASEQSSQLGKEVNWADRLDELFPFRFNTLTVHDGTVRFQAPGISTNDALVARQLEATISNLTNVVTREKETFADFKATANVLETGAATVDGSINPLAPTPMFDVNLAVKKVSLPRVNPWLRQYIKADANSGDFELYLEIAAADGRFKGYAKPLMQNVDLHGTEDENKPALRKLWEGVVDFAAKIFENKDKEQVAARIPFSGSMENPRAGILEAIVSVLRNAFVSAFAHSLEGSISIRDVKKSLEPYGPDERTAKNKDEQAKEEEKDKGTDKRGPKETIGSGAQ